MRAIALHAIRGAKCRDEIREGFWCSARPAAFAVSVSAILTSEAVHSIWRKTMSIAMVTGAGSGIGRVVARKLIDDGFTVLLVGRRKDKLQETADGASDENRAVPFACDVTEPASVETLFSFVEDRFGRLDVLFNNAGISAKGALPDELSIEDWTRVISTNLTGVYLVARGAFSLMRRQLPQGGRIINNGSVSSYVPRPHAIAYNASKHAVTGITKSLSLDGRPFNIACGQIDIGNVRTEMVSEIVSGIRQADNSLRSEPTFEVAHVADAVSYMARLPLEANVQFMTVMATTMPYIGRG